MKKIPHSRPHLDSRDIKSVEGVLDSGHVTSGPVSEKFSALVSRLLSKKWTVPVQSGTDALALALKTLGLGEKARVAVPAYTCGAILDAVAMLRLEPIPVDIDRNNLAVDVSKVNGIACDAVIAAHLFGIPAPFHRIGNRNLIEDCAQCLGCQIGGETVGSMGVLSVCSFFGTKIVTAGHGGALSGDAPRLRRRALETIRHDKIERWSPHFHFAMSDYNAALGTSQVKKIRALIGARLKIAAVYLSALGEHTRPRNGIYYRFLVIPRRGSATSLIRRFNNAGIEAKKPVYKPLYMLLGLRDSQYPESAWAHRNLVSVPIYPSMNDNEIKTVSMFLGKNRNEMRCWPPA